MDAPRSRYARIERERRWLLPELPTDLAVCRTLEIGDRYLRGTSLRLRVVAEAGAETVHKLGHKTRFRPDEPSTVAHTTMYLDVPTYEVLAVLPADQLVKTRHLLAGEHPTWVVDLFHGELEGLVLAEIDLGDSPQPPGLTPPVPTAVEVTSDDRFTGGALARCSRADLTALLGDLRR